MIAKTKFRQWTDQLLCEENQQKFHARCNELKNAFTEHPTLTGETYGEHLLFTVKISLRFIIVSLILLVHGVFPFLFTHTASRQIERIYLIMKSRIPKARRTYIDENYDI